MRTHSDDRVRRSNRLLRALPDEDYERLNGQLRHSDVQRQQGLAEAGQPVLEVHFPLDAVVSILTRMGDGSSVEIATIGNEGVVGLPVAWGGGAMTPHAFATVDVPGEIVGVNADLFRQEVQRRGALTSLVERYTLAFLGQVSQQVACNGLHSVEQRCARWILLTLDRVGTEEFPMTHESLARRLGVRRATVTVTAGRLKRSGIVEFSRGRVAVVDRAGLEKVACECFSVTRAVFDRLLP